MHDSRCCANCDRVGHDLSICVGPPASDGAIHGCPCCNTTVHLFDSCPRTRIINADLVYCCLVLLRGRRPPISTKQDYLQMAVDRPPSEFYPCTRTYSRAVDPSTAPNFDYSPDNPRDLPSDPATSSQAAIWQSLDYAVKRPFTASQPQYLSSVYRDGIDQRNRNGTDRRRHSIRLVVATHLISKTLLCCMKSYESRGLPSPMCIREVRTKGPIRQEA